MIRFSLFLCAALGFAGCSGPQKPPAPAANSASKVAIAVEVDQSTTFAGGFNSELAARLRQELLETRVGVPVTDASSADLVLKVTIMKANFSNATQWEWQLVDVDSGAIVAANTDTSAMGRNAGPLARDVVTALGGLDLDPYIGNAALAVAAAPKRAAPVQLPASSTDGSKSWAVIVGVESYREKLPAATGARADAEAFAAYVQQTLNVPASNVKLLVGDRATRADMTGALNEWLPRNAVADGGRVYVFFSGHGAPNVEDGSAYLLPYDADPAYIKSGGIQVASLQKQLAAMKGQETYLFLDACFSGVGDRTVLPAGTRPVVAVQDLKRVNGVTTFAAAGGAQTTGAAPDGTHGLFTYFLLDGLRGAADRDANADITVGELQQFVEERVEAEARRQNREQRPTVTTHDEATAVVRGITN